MTMDSTSLLCGKRVDSPHAQQELLYYNITVHYKVNPFRRKNKTLYKLHSLLYHYCTTFFFLSIVACKHSQKIFSVANR